MILQTSEIYGSSISDLEEKEEIDREIGQI
jgi:hypothetical protein